MSRLIILAILLAIVLDILLVVPSVIRRMRQKWEADQEGNWEIIEPSEWEDGKQVPTSLSQHQKARRVLNARVFYDSRSSLRAWYLVIGVLFSIALLILVPVLLIFILR